MMNLKEILGLFDPATSIEILIMGTGSIYRGALMNLSYCEIREMLDCGVFKIKMKIEKYEHRVLIMARK